MKTNYVAFLNKHGIACASDTDMTLYALSKKEPVAIAVNPYSPIPWDNIINAYLRQGDIALHDDFVDYARDFAEFLKTVNCQKKWAGLTEEKTNMIFVGFGLEDLFPSGVYAYVRHNNDSNTLECELREVCRIDHKNTSDYGTLGNFENMQPVLYGISDAAKTSLADRQEKDMNKYKERMKKALDNAHCDVALDDMPYDTQNAFSNELEDMINYHQDRLIDTVASFNIEDMVKVAETFIDANDQLEHLKAGGFGNPNSTKELAVITRTEGLVWIKHCLFGL